MLVLVKKPDQSVCEIDLPPKSLGQECLDQVCNELGIIEIDYFGLQFTRKNGSDPMWLNLRNAINSQLTGSSPLRLQLRVKFCVQPHLVQQETTRRLFFQDVKLDLMSGKIFASSKETARLTALLCQAELGDYTHNSQHYVCLPSSFCGCTSDDFMMQVMAEHARLRGMKQSLAEYKFLQEASVLDSYGMDMYQGKDPNGQSVLVGVGPQGIQLYEEDSRTECLQRISLDMMLKESINGKCFTITYPEDVNDQILPVTLSVKLRSKEAAETLYRAVTEKHEFFFCDTVQQDIRTQCSRDLKGTLASIFTENTEYGKKFMFDVQRTWKEVYDSTRRKLHTAEMAQRQSEQATTRTLESDDNREDGACAMTGVNAVGDMKSLQDRLETITDGILCKVCMSTKLDTALSPCGHLFCSGCMEQVEVCPLCRVAIQEKLHIFLPL